jgi:ubiquilin
MADMLSNPNVAQAMNEALNNPQLVDVMIQSNPMLRDNPNAREIIQSPFFRNMLTNPDMLRTLAQMRRSMGGGAGSEAFPAPGATDTTPSDAAATGAGGASNAQPPQLPFMIPGMFGGPGAGGGLGGAGGQAPNPFAALFNPFGTAASAAPSTGVGAHGASSAAGGTGATGTTRTPAGDGAAQRNAPGDTGSAPPSQPGGTSPAQPQNPFAGLFGGPQGGAANPFGMTPEMMQSLMQNLMGGAAEPAAPADTRPPEERYAEQLSQLNEMGFYDFDQNVAALRRSGGNVQGAVNFLLGG